jgi:hypothetical protein
LVLHVGLDTVKEIRELHGLLHNDEVGLMVSSGGFTSDAAREARSSSKHVDMIDLERLVTLWQQHYGRMSEEARAMLAAGFGFEAQHDGVDVGDGPERRAWHLAGCQVVERIASGGGKVMSSGRDSVGLGTAACAL